MTTSADALEVLARVQSHTGFSDPFSGALGGDTLALAVTPPGGTQGPPIRSFLAPHSLAAHKLALRAIEEQAVRGAGVAMRRRKVRTTIDQFRAAKLQLRAVHNVAARLAVQHAIREFQELGLTPAKAKLPNSDYLNKLYNDLRMSLRRPDGVHRGGLTRKEKGRRTALAVGAIANRSYSDAQLALYDAVMTANPGVILQKRWETNQDGRACEWCRNLHGQIIGIHDEFNTIGPAVYGDLQGPPRHLNCRCRIVLVKWPMQHTVELAAPGHRRFSIRHVKTTKGADFYNVPVGSPITLHLKELAQKLHGGSAVSEIDKHEDNAPDVPNAPGAGGKPGIPNAPGKAPAPGSGPVAPAPSPSKVSYPVVPTIPPEAIKIMEAAHHVLKDPIAHKNPEKPAVPPPVDVKAEAKTAATTAVSAISTAEKTNNPDHHEAAAQALRNTVAKAAAAGTPHPSAKLMLQKADEHDNKAVTGREERLTGVKPAVPHLEQLQSVQAAKAVAQASSDKAEKSGDPHDHAVAAEHAKAAAELEKTIPAIAKPEEEKPGVAKPAEQRSPEGQGVPEKPDDKAVPEKPVNRFAPTKKEDQGAPAKAVPEKTAPTEKAPTQTVPEKPVNMFAPKKPAQDKTIRKVTEPEKPSALETLAAHHTKRAGGEESTNPVSGFQTGWEATQQPSLVPTNITDDEYQAASGYSKAAFLVWNDHLRSSMSESLPDQMEESISSLKGLIRSTRVTSPILTHRGINAAVFPEASVPTGTIIQDHGFISTSTKDTIAARFPKGGVAEPADMAIELPVGAHALSIPGMMGERENLSESELVLMPDSRFEVVSDTPATATTPRSIRAKLVVDPPSSPPSFLRAPAKKAPAKKVPAKKVPVKKAPAKKVKKASPVTTTPPVNLASWGDRGAEIKVAQSKPSLGELFLEERTLANHWGAPDLETAAKVYDFQHGDLRVQTVSVERNGVNQLIVEGRITRAGRKVGVFDRRIDIFHNEVTAQHTGFILDTAVQGKGLATAWNRNTENWYIANGIKDITLEAGDAAGGYVWARSGYTWAGHNFDVQTISRRIAPILKKMSKGIPAADAAKLQADLADINKRAVASNFDTPAYPTPYELSEFGRAYFADKPSAHGDWPGRAGMKGSEWSAVKHLVPPAHTSSSVPSAQAAKKVPAKKVPAKKVPVKKAPAGTIPPGEYHVKGNRSIGKAHIVVKADGSGSYVSSVGKSSPLTVAQVQKRFHAGMNHDPHKGGTVAPKAPAPAHSSTTPTQGEIYPQKELAVGANAHYDITAPAITPVDLTPRMRGLGMSVPLQQSVAKVNGLYAEKYGVSLSHIESLSRDALGLHRKQGNTQDPLAYVLERRDILADPDEVSQVTLGVRKSFDEAELQSYEDLGWFAPGSGSTQGVLTHEMGHALLQHPLWVRGRDRRTLALVKARIAAGKAGAPFDFALGRYAQSSSDEAIAEVFACYHWGGDRRPGWVVAWGQALHHELGLDPTPFSEMKDRSVV